MFRRIPTKERKSRPRMVESPSNIQNDEDNDEKNFYYDKDDKDQIIQKKTIIPVVKINNIQPISSYIHDKGNVNIPSLKKEVKFASSKRFCFTLHNAISVKQKFDSATNSNNEETKVPPRKIDKNRLKSQFYSRFVNNFVLQYANNTIYPTSTTYLCDYCRDNIEGRPLCMPKAIVEKLSTTDDNEKSEKSEKKKKNTIYFEHPHPYAGMVLEFEITGEDIYCRFGCVLADAMEIARKNGGDYISKVKRMYELLNGCPPNLPPLKPTPNYKLSVTHGGPLSVQEYYDGDNPYNLVSKTNSIPIISSQKCYVKMGVPNRSKLLL